ncbi:MAG: hypothetical protein JO199_04920 [Candidatus Eremiobacteraeota bacterium]|nr:hypothetical protein [Candidatus Eremiobacteraeota bacterium]
MRCAIRILTALVLAGCSSLPATAPLAPDHRNAAVAESRTIVPMEADAFVDSLGVNTHLLYDLSRPSNRQIFIQRMRQLGIRHVRDGIFPGQTAAQNAVEREFFSRTHTDMLALIDCPKPLGYFPGAQTPPPVVRKFDNDVGGAVAALEGPNEPDLRRVKKWVSLTRSCIAGDDRHQALPVPFVASAMGYPTSAPRLGNIAALVDIGGIHRYFSGNNPGTRGFWKMTSCGWWEGMATDVCFARINAGSAAPLWITETGYSTDGQSTSGYDAVLDQTAFAKYESRVLFVDSIAGIARTYLYEFQDDGTDATNSENGYGLLRYDGSPKPAFSAVANIVALLNDPGPSFTPSPLRFSIERPDSSIRYEAFEKRDGTFTIALWNEVSSWDVATGTGITVPAVSVRLSFSSAPRGVQYRALDDSGALRARSVTTSGSSVTVPVDDHVAFLTFE